MIGVTALLYVLAFIFFLLAFLGVNRPPLSWRDAAFACLTFVAATAVRT